MNESPSRYGGVAAVFGIGLVAVGRAWTGVGVLLFGTLALALALATTGSSKALIMAVVAVIGSGLLAYRAASNEITGQATYHRGFGRTSQSEDVTRDGAPAKFREATNLLWGGSVLALLGGAVAFTFHRKADGCAADF